MPLHQKLIRAAAAFAVLLVSIFAAEAQVCIPLGGVNPSSHVQDFDGLTNSPAPQFTDTANIQILQASGPRIYLGKFDNAENDAGGPVNVPGWALVEVGSNVTATTGRYGASDGSASGPNTYSYGTNADRALGSLNDSTIHENYLGGCFTNTSAGTLTEVRVGFTGEMWRRGAAGSHTDSLTFEYAVGAQNLYSDLGASTPYTAFTALDFVTPNTTGSAGARDGNLAAYRTVVGLQTVPVTLGPNQTLYIRWVDRDITQNDDGLAIDDVIVHFFIPSAAPMQVTGTVLDANGRGINRATVTLTSPQGNVRTVTTNGFGYYRFSDVPAGQSFVMEVSSKGYRFNNPTRVIDTNDDLGSVDFQASQGLPGAVRDR
ncbi:MAG: carboxypeptidase regulatory-like domain-containing protein [Acidobacteria bacterium]|nr:carboxypeptidase regulatory-like domain-containing protein [Acidobacteriota bacterium]